jgi:hypothetical protein
MPSLYAIDAIARGRQLLSGFAINVIFTCFQAAGTTPILRMARHKAASFWKAASPRRVSEEAAQPSRPGALFAAFFA